MPRMKKSLQPKKKLSNPNPNTFAISPRAFLNPFQVDLTQRNYWDAGRLNQTAHIDFGAYYYGHLTGKLTADTYLRCHRSQPVGIFVIHPESGLCKSAFKEYLKSMNSRVSWETYYKSILAEQINLNALAMYKEAIKFGLEPIFVSTTPTKYKHFVVEWLTRHSLMSPENPRKILFKGTFKTKDHHFLEAAFWQVADRENRRTQAYFLFDSNKYPRIGWFSMSDTF